MSSEEKTCEKIVLQEVAEPIAAMTLIEASDTSTENCAHTQTDIGPCDAALSSPSEASCLEVSPSEASPSEASRLESSRSEASPSEASRLESSRSEASHSEASRLETSRVVPRCNKANAPLQALKWIWELRVPILVVAAMVVVPKLILLWIALILARPVCLWIYKFLPDAWKIRMTNSMPSFIGNSSVIKDLNEGADQGLPFVLLWMYLFCAPFALAWMFIYWVRGFLPETHHREKNKKEDKLVFSVSESSAGKSENNFYHSRVFGIVLIAFFALGIPSLISQTLYEKLGIEQMVATSPATKVQPLNSGVPPKPKKIDIKPQAYTQSDTTTFNIVYARGPVGADATVVQGYSGYWPFLQSMGLEPSKNRVMFLHLYLFGLASALSVLFFRTWFSFPLNFLADDYDVELTKHGIKRKTLKGWFLSVLTINRWAFSGGPDSIEWSDIKSLRSFEEGFARLCPLPETIFKKETLAYQLLNKLASFMEGLMRKPSAGNYLIFSSTESGADFGRSVKIDLNALNRTERAKLFYSVKSWAPHVVIHPGVEEQLVGSAVLKDNRYTQLWFDLLTTKTRSRRTDTLAPGELLKNAEYKIQQRLSAGGQATTYLASDSAGHYCVLKEFILATSSSGALIESAREFEAEVGLLSQLDHPGVVKLKDFFSEDRRLYVALEYAEGRTLRQLVQEQGALTEREVVRISLALCDVLEYLHGCNPSIVHRDVTPENIILAPDGSIKLIDFSLAVRNDGRQTTDSSAKQAFTPPEQFREEVTPQSDIYALGATMHFLLTGASPKPISRSSPQRKAPTISDAMNRIVEQSTEPELAHRYSSVKWLKLDLANLQEH